MRRFGDEYMERSVGDEYNKFTKELIKIAKGAGLKMELNNIIKCGRSSYIKSPYLCPVFYTVGNSFESRIFQKVLVEYQIYLW